MPLILYALGGRIGCAASHSQIDVPGRPPGTASLWLASGRRWGSLNVSDSSSRDSETHSQYTQARALIGAESTPYSSTKPQRPRAAFPSPLRTRSIARLEATTTATRPQTRSRRGAYHRPKRPRALTRPPRIERLHHGWAQGWRRRQGSTWTRHICLSDER